MISSNGIVLGDLELGNLFEKMNSYSTKKKRKVKYKIQNTEKTKEMTEQRIADCVALENEFKQKFAGLEIIEIPCLKQEKLFYSRREDSDNKNLDEIDEKFRADLGIKSEREVKQERIVKEDNELLNKMKDYMNELFLNEEIEI